MALKHICWNRAEEPSIQHVSEAISKEGYAKFVFPWPRQYHHGPAQTTHDACFWLQRGEISFISEGQKIEMKAGDRVYCPKGISYEIHVNSMTGCYLFEGKKM